MGGQGIRFFVGLGVEGFKGCLAKSMGDIKACIIIRIVTFPRFPRVQFFRVPMVCGFQALRV